MSVASLKSTSPNSGYFGLAHRDTAIAYDKRRTEEFIARFKHALLFTPKLVLADHMIFSPNFQEAYRADQNFKYLLREELIDLAHFEKFANGRAFTLVETRKFHEYLRRNRDSRYDPRDPSCPSDPFDPELEAIQASVGKLFPDGAQRDPLFTEFADEELANDTLKADFADLHGIYKTAYRRLREDCRAQNIPLGIVHFDEFHKAPGVNNIFDYMARVSSLQSVPRQRLVDEFAEKVAHAYRVLLIKAEMHLLSGVHAILPADLASYRTLVLTAPGVTTIDEREAQVRELKIDLSSVNERTLKSLTFEEILELRDAGQEFFETIQNDAHKPECFDSLCGAIGRYSQHISDALAFKDAPTSRRSSVATYITILQGKVARHPRWRDEGIALMFKIIGGVAHSLLSFSFVPGASAAVDAHLRQLEGTTKSILTPSPFGDSIKDVKSTLALSGTPEQEQLLQYE